MPIAGELLVSSGAAAGAEAAAGVAAGAGDSDVSLGLRRSFGVSSLMWPHVTDRAVRGNQILRTVELGGDIDTSRCPPIRK
jgi:hypothetical protein